MLLLFCVGYGSIGERKPCEQLCVGKKEKEIWILNMWEPLSDAYGASSPHCPGRAKREWPRSHLGRGMGET